MVFHTPESPEVVGHRLLMADRIDELEVENDVLRSAWMSVIRRIRRAETRRRRWAVVAFALGVLVALVADGTLANLLTRIGI